MPKRKKVLNPKPGGLQGRAGLGWTVPSYRRAADFRNIQGGSAIPSVHYGAGWGGLSLARPRPYLGPGGYVAGNPGPAPVRGPLPLIPWTGPRLLPPIFNGDLSGVLVGRGPERGQGQGMPKKKPCPRPLSGVGRGNGPGARGLRGPVRPVTNSSYTMEYRDNHWVRPLSKSREKEKDEGSHPVRRATQQRGCQPQWIDQGPTGRSYRFSQVVPCYRRESVTTGRDPGPEGDPGRRKGKAGGSKVPARCSSTV